jgi:hypothetical protein
MIAGNIVVVTTLLIDVLSTNSEGKIKKSPRLVPCTNSQSLESFKENVSPSNQTIL